MRLQNNKVNDFRMKVSFHGVDREDSLQKKTKKDLQLTVDRLTLPEFFGV